MLNDFFRIVVAAVDERGGLINKFQGDAALAVFGAPITTVAADAALSTAGRWRRTCARCPSSTSASAFRRERCSQATSAPRTATNTR